MKKYYILYIVFAALICFFYTYTTFNNSKTVTDSKKKNDMPVVHEKVKNDIDIEVIADEVVDEEKYTVKSENSKIIVYNSENEVIKQLNIDYDSLREYDKKQFDDGIVVENIEEVYHIAEDFSE